MKSIKKTFGFLGLIGMLLALNSCENVLDIEVNETEYPCKMVVYNNTYSPIVTISSVEYSLTGENNWKSPKLYDIFLDTVSNIEYKAFFYLKDPGNYDFKFLDKDGNVIGKIVEDATVVERSGNSLKFYVYNDTVTVSN